MQTLYIISHTHWDREWYKTFQQFRLKLVHLVDNLLTILDSDPTYLHFMLDGQTIVLEDYLQMRMANFPRLLDYIRTGRVLIGPWYILPDEFLVSPEATVRNLLIGRQICNLFGQRMMVGYIPDPFGHISQMPQILEGFGIDTACLWRGVPDGSPTLVKWQAPDGSEVLLAHLYNGYGNIANWPAADEEQSMHALDAAADTLEPHNPTPYYLMMRGTDHLEPRPELPGHIRHYNAHNSTGRTALHSTLPAYLEAVKTTIEQDALTLIRLKGELRDPHKAHMLPAVLSARMWIKQRNHYAQTLMERWVEPFCTWAELACRGEDAFTPLANFERTDRLADPGPVIQQAWKLLINNHPHDSICGCSVDETHNDMITRFDQVEQIGEELTAQSLEALTARVNTARENEAPALAAVTVFNAAPYAKKGVVQVDVDVPAGCEGLQVRDSQGDLIPSVWEPQERRLVESNSYSLAELNDLLSEAVAQGHNKKSLVNASLSSKDGLPCIDAEFSALLEPNSEGLGLAFEQILALLTNGDPATQVSVRVFNSASAQVRFTATDVPAFGLATYWVEADIAADNEPADDVPGDAREIENEFFQVGIENDSGSLYVMDKRNGHTLHGLNQFLDVGDRGDEYNFTPPEHDRKITPRVLFSEASGDNLGQSLRLQCVLELPESLAESRDSRSEITVSCPLDVQVSLTRGVPAVDVQVGFENRALDHRLEVRFPTGLKVDFARYDGHFDVVQRGLDLPQTDASWRELPRPEVPQRAFTDVSTDGRGLMLANVGLPEVATLRDEQGNAVIALTLLRSVGWLSRDDLWNRQGHAGPPIATPDAQEQDDYTFNYRIIPHDGNWLEAAPLAHTFQTELEARATTCHSGTLEAVTRFVAVEPAAFLVTTIKEAENEAGWILRGVNLSNETIQLQARPLVPALGAALVTLDERFIEDIPLVDGQVCIPAGPHKIVTLFFRTAD